MLDLDAIRKRYDLKCAKCNGEGVLGTSFAFGRCGCWVCLGRGITNPMPEDVAAMLDELDRLYKSADPVPPTPQEQEAAIAGELRRMVTKPRTAGTEAGASTASRGVFCPRCSSVSVSVYESENGRRECACLCCGGKW